MSNHETRVYLSPPDVGEAEEAALVRALRSGWVAPLGPEVDTFESELAARAGVEFAVALSSGTAALHLALLELGARPGTVVVTSTMTFAATVNAIVYTGARPVLVDVDAATGNLNPELLERTLRTLAAEGATVAAVVPVDLLGKAADYTRILPIAARFGVPVLADAAESLGASHAGRPSGSFGDAAVFSFNGNKIMTTSGGGALLTNCRELAGRVRHLATQAREPVVHYEHAEVGYNYRLSNLLAAMGRAQLSRVDQMIARRRALRDGYRELFNEVDGVQIFGGDGDSDDNVWLTSIIVDPTMTGWSAADLSVALAVNNIEARPLWKPMHLQPVFRGERAFVDGTAERLFDRGLTLPSGSGQTPEQRDRVHAVIREFIEART